ncbi:MAG: type II toxin-antitoxin system RelE/ParE family toxin [Peptococcia bacterium]
MRVPICHNILFAIGIIWILLHHFLKKTKKTPRREIEQAKRNLTDYLERSE